MYTLSLYVSSKGIHRLIRKLIKERGTFSDCSSESSDRSVKEAHNHDSSVEVLCNRKEEIPFIVTQQQIEDRDYSKTYNGSRK
jgi:hypothetical protein